MILIAYAPDWLSDIGAIEVFPKPLNWYCPRDPGGNLGGHLWEHIIGWCGGCDWICANCHKRTDCGCS